jgi:hypothetical protein
MKIIISKFYDFCFKKKSAGAAGAASKFLLGAGAAKKICGSETLQVLSVAKNVG